MTFHPPHTFTASFFKNSATSNETADVNTTRAAHFVGLGEDVDMDLLYVDNFGFVDG